MAIVNGVGQPERVTQNRVATLFRDQLGYRHLGTSSATRNPQRAVCGVDGSVPAALEILQADAEPAPHFGTSLDVLSVQNIGLFARYSRLNATVFARLARKSSRPRDGILEVEMRVQATIGPASPSKASNEDL